jgi:hypothetical protein
MLKLFLSLSTFSVVAQVNLLEQLLKILGEALYFSSTFSRCSSSTQLAPNPRWRVWS